MQKFYSLIILCFVLSNLTLPAELFAGCQQCVIGGQLEGEGTSATSSSTTVGKGKTSVGFLYSHRNWDTVDSRQVHRDQHRRELKGDEHAHVHNKIRENHFFLTASHGVTDNFDFSILLPYAQIESRNTHDHDRLGKTERSTGIGDLVLLAKYRFWNKLFEAAFLGGMKFPTGETREKDGSGERFEPEEQPGSGSFDPILGLAASKDFGKFRLDSSMVYTIRTQGDQQYEFGNSLKINGAVSVKVWKWIRDIVFYATLEANAVFEDRDKQDGETIEETGATILYLTPGLRLHGGDRWVAYVSAPLPAVQNRPSGHQDVDYSILAGISFLF